MATVVMLVKNTAYHAGARIWQIATALFLAPLILSYLGDNQFGVWVLFWACSSYFMFMDMGLGVSLVREVAMAEHQQSWKAVNEAINSLLFLYVCLGAMVTLLVWLLTPWIMRMANPSPDLKVFISHILLWSSGIFALIGVVNVYSAVLRGLQRYDKITHAYLIQVCLLAFYVKKLMPSISYGIEWISWSRIKAMLPFGMRIQVSKFAELASYQSDKLLLAWLLPIHFVTMYDLGSRIASLIRDLPYSLTSAVFPAASEMHSQDQHKKLWKMYDRGSKYILVVTVPMLLGLWLTAHLIIGMWLGHVAIEVYQSVLFLSFAYWVVISLAMVFSVGTGMGWSQPIMFCALLQGFLNVVLSYVLIREVGFIGALYGTAVSISIANGILYLKFCRDFQQSLTLELQRLWRVLKANMLPVICCGGFVVYANTWLIWGDRLQSSVVMVIAMLIYALLYIFSLRFTAVFDSEDVSLLGDKIPMLKKLVVLIDDKGEVG